MNLLTAARDGGAVVLDGRPLPVAAPPGAGPVVLGLRAEELHPVAPGTPGALDLAIAHVEELGAQRLVHGHVAGQPLVAAVAADLALADRLALGLNPQAAHLFDAASGRRLA